MTMLALALGSLLAASPAHDANEEGVRPLTVDQVQAMIDRKDVDVFDNNGKDRYVKSHVPTATWVQFNEVKESDLPRDKSRNLVFYCANEH